MTCLLRITLLEAWWQMLILTDSELFYIHENPKSKKVHGTLGLGWKYQGRTVLYVSQNCISFLFYTYATFSRVEEHSGFHVCMLMDWERSKYGSTPPFLIVELLSLLLAAMYTYCSECLSLFSGHMVTIGGHFGLKNDSLTLTSLGQTVWLT